MRETNYWQMLCEQRDAIISSLKEELKDARFTILEQAQQAIKMRRELRDTVPVEKFQEWKAESEMIAQQSEIHTKELCEKLSDSQKIVTRLESRVIHLVTNNEELEREVKALRMYITEVIEGGTAVS